MTGQLDGSSNVGDGAARGSVRHRQDLTHSSLSWTAALRTQRLVSFLPRHFKIGAQPQ